MSLEESNGQLPPETFDTDEHVITVPPPTETGEPSFTIVMQRDVPHRLETGEEYQPVGVVLTNSKRYNAYFTCHFKDGYLILNCVTSDEL